MWLPLLSLMGLSLSFAIGGNGQGCLMAIQYRWMSLRRGYHIRSGTVESVLSAYRADDRSRQLQTPEMRTEYTFAGKHLRCTLKTPLQTLVVGETVLKVKVPPVRIENPLSPCSGVQTFLLSPGLLRQSGGGHIKEKSPVHRKDRPGIFPLLYES